MRIGVCWRMALPVSGTGLALFSEGFGISRWNIVTAAAVMAVIPIIVVFAFTQRHFIEGITLGSSKG